MSVYIAEICLCTLTGYAQVLSEDLSQVVTVIGPGKYFGDVCVCVYVCVLYD